jgi:hypothetical protein
VGMPLSHSFSTTRLEVRIIWSLRGSEIKSSSTRYGAVYTTHTEPRTSTTHIHTMDIPVNDGAYAPIHMDARL